MDVCDACRRVVNILDGRPRRHLHLTKPCILVADQFFPSDLFTLDRRMILGLASALPALILLAVITAAVIVCIKKARKKRKAKKAAQDPTPPQDPQ